MPGAEEGFASDEIQQDDQQERRIARLAVGVYLPLSSTSPVSSAGSDGAHETSAALNDWKLVDHPGLVWNQLRDWLRAMDSLRRAS